MYTQSMLDRDVIGPLTTLAQPAAPVVDDDPFVVEGLVAPSWWRGDEEASLSGLMVDVRST